MPHNCVNDQILWPHDGSLIPSGLLQTIEMTLHYPLEMSPYSLVKIVTKWLSLWCFLSSLVLVLLFLLASLNSTFRCLGLPHSLPSSSEPTFDSIKKMLYIFQEGERVVECQGLFIQLVNKFLLINLKPELARVISKMCMKSSFLFI